MIDFLMWAGGIIFTMAVTITGWVFTMIFRKLDEQEKALNAHELYSARIFTTKLEIKEVLDRIDHKLNSIEEKIDKKADKRSGH